MDGMMDVYEGDYMFVDGVGMEGEGGKLDIRLGDRSVIT